MALAAAGARAAAVKVVHGSALVAKALAAHNAEALAAAVQTARMVLAAVTAVAAVADSTGAGVALVAGDA